MEMAQGKRNDLVVCKDQVNNKPNLIRPWYQRPIFMRAENSIKKGGSNETPLQVDSEYNWL